MKEKIKKWIKIIFFKFAEVGTVYWAVDNMLSHYRFREWGLRNTAYDYPISPVLAYFFSAVLILYLLRKYERGN